MEIYNSVRMLHIYKDWYDEGSLFQECYFVFYITTFFYQIQIKTAQFLISNSCCVIASIISGSYTDACIRVINSNKIFLGVLCISFITNELFASSNIIPQNEDFYQFIIDTTGM